MRHKLNRRPRVATTNVRRGMNASGQQFINVTDKLFCRIKARRMKMDGLFLTMDEP
jgi:hypothetical protein